MEFDDIDSRAFKHFFRWVQGPSNALKPYRILPKDLAQLWVMDQRFLNPSL